MSQTIQDLTADLNKLEAGARVVLEGPANRELIAAGLGTGMAIARVAVMLEVLDLTVKEILQPVQSRRIMAALGEAMSLSKERVLGADQTLPSTELPAPGS